MLIRRFTFTILTFIFLLLSLYAEGMIFPSNGVSPETPLAKERLTVKQGVSQDGRVTIAHVAVAPQISPREKTSNGPRTLRAFIGASENGIPTFYIESVKPHQYYTITGTFAVAPSYPRLMWLKSSVLVFYIMTEEHDLARAELDVETLSLRTESVSEKHVSTETEQFDLETIL